MIYQERESTLPIKCLIIAGLAFLFTLQLFQFMQGYRLTADDALFLQYAWQGWDQVWQAANETAIHDGRIAQYMMTPLNVLGSYLAGNVITRAIMVAGYYSVMALFSLHASQLIARGSLATAALIFLSLLSLHPLVYEHMPPTSYPLQNTLPFFILISIRLYAWSHPQLSMLLQSFLYVAMALLMMVSEYVFLLGTTLMAVEHLANAADPQHGVRQQYLGPIPIRTRPIVADAVLTVIVLAANLAFRIAFPSEYAGNTPNGLSNAGDFIATALLHAVAGTAFYRIPGMDISNVTTTTWMESILVGMVTLACFWTLLLRLPRFSFRKVVATSGVCLFFMLYVTLPLAANSKYQRWCLEGGSCGYLDSRTAYLGVGILFLCFIAALSLAIKQEGPRKLICMLVAIAFSCLAAFNHSNNKLMAIDMKKKSQAWINARQLVCDNDTTNSRLNDLASKVDPNNRVDFHPNMDRHAYWLEYLQYLRDSRRCDTSE